jgi:hypothetical protein
MPAEPGLAPDDRALLERLAARVTERRLELPAILALESVRPVSRVASQALVFFQPFLMAFFKADEYRRFTGLAERPEALAALVEMIEAGVDARERTRAAARKPAGPTRGSGA